MDILEKENSIKKLLSEMALPKVKEAGFTDLLVSGFIKNSCKENIDRWGSNGDTLLPAPMIITDEIEKTSLTSFTERLSNISLNKTSIKDGILRIVYEGKKQFSVNIEHLNRIFIMKAGDNHVY